MTSDRTPTPAEQRLVEFADLIFRGKHASRRGVDPEQAELVVRLKEGDHVPPFDATVFQPRKEHLMSLVNTAPAGATPGSGTIAAPPNGRLPYPMPSYPRARSWRPTVMQLVSAAVLLALIGGLIFGITQNRNDANPTVPAVIQGSPSPEASPLGADWGQFRGGVERTGYSSDPGPGANLNLLWSFNADESMNGIMEADGKVFVYGAEGGLYAIDAITGEQLWAIDLVDGQFGDAGRVPLPAIANGVVYVSTPTGVLVAVDSESGALLWQQPVSDSSLLAPTVAGDHIYVTSGGKQLLSLAADSGTQEWSWEVPGGVSTQYPTIADGKLFITDDETAVHAIDVETGEPIWSTEPIRGIRVSAYQDGTLFVPGDDGRITALDAITGEVLWSTEPKGNQAMNPIATADAIIVAVESEDVRALDPESGQVLWTLPTPGLDSSPHAGGDTVYVQTDLTTLIAVDLATGTSLGTADDTGAGSTAAISGDVLVMSGREGPVRAFGPVGGDPNEVTAVAPVPITFDAPAETAATAEPDAVEAPAADDLQADLLFTQSIAPDQFIAGFQKAPDGTLWVANHDGTLLVLDRDGNLIETRHYTEGGGPQQFDWEIKLPRPFDLWWQGASFAWLPDGRVQVTDAGNARIQTMDKDGKLIGEWGSRGSGDGQFQAPVWITLTPNNELAVVDPGRNDIQWFDLDGNFLRKLTGPMAGEQFRRPVEIEYDSNGDFWVLDFSYARIHKFDASGNLLFTIGDFATSAPGAFDDPVDIDIDEMDRVWVADQLNHRIQVFDASGNLLSVWNGCESDANCFQFLNWVIYGGNDFLFVYDFDLNAVQDQRMMKFKITSMPEVPMMAAATPAPQGSPTAG